MNSILGGPVAPSPVPEEKEEPGPISDISNSLALHVVGVGFLAELMEIGKMLGSAIGGRTGPSVEAINPDPAKQINPSTAFLPR